MNIFCCFLEHLQSFGPHSILRQGLPEINYKSDYGAKLLCLL